jgi:hypothetical protein
MSFDAVDEERHQSRIPCIQPTHEFWPNLVRGMRKYKITRPRHKDGV